MKQLVMGAALAFSFALLCVSAPAQMAPPPAPPMPGGGAGMPQPEPAGPPDQPRKTGIADAPTDDWPEKRNPFWPIDLVQANVSADTNRPAAAPVRHTEVVVDWKDATKYVKDSARVSVMGQKILVALDGKIYEIGQSFEISRNGNIYTFKLLDGAKLEQLRVRPAGD